MTPERLKEIRAFVARAPAYLRRNPQTRRQTRDNYQRLSDLLADRDALAAELDDWRSGKLRLAPLQTVPASTNTHKEDLR